MKTETTVKNGKPVKIHVSDNFPMLKPVTRHEVKLEVMK